MKIDDLLVTNWEHPGHQWWQDRERNPDAPGIQVRMQLTLSYNEYQAILAMERQASNPVNTTLQPRDEGSDLSFID